MDVLLTFVSTDRRGRTRRDPRRVAGPLVTIGRGSKSELHLADPRVAYVHAKIAIGDGGATIEAAEGPVEVNGRRVDRSALVPGDTVEIGPYRIEVETASGDVVLALAINAAPGTPGSTDDQRKVTTKAPRLSKRRLSYLAFFGVLLLTLIVPLAGDWLGAYATRSGAGAVFADVAPTVTQRFLQTWSPGALSQSHQVFGHDCRACHQYAFLQVRDSACIACHQTIAEHVPRAELTGVRGIAFAQTRCAECHRDHKTTHMAPRAQDECAACHADVKSAAPNAVSENVTDFGVDHPQFRLSFIDAERPKTVRRVRLGSAQTELVERSNLKFNHALHMNPAGVRDPENRVSVLKCSGCHRPNEGGRTMEPVSMERDCRQCHSLAFEPKVTKRQVPHGSAEEAAITVREFYARLVLGDVPPGVTPPPDLPRMRPGAVLSYEDRQQVLRIADERAQRVMRELFETRAVCSTCHYVRRDEREGWKVAPVRLTRVWMPQALFSHAKHATESCTLCHQSERSKDARDVAMPGVEVCQECHVGARPVLGKVTSDCASCHEFHAGRNYWHDALQTQMQSRNKK